MGGVADGQLVDASVTNAAFIEKNADDFTSFKLGMQSTETGDGTGFTSAQAEINGLCTYTGRSVGSGFSSLPTWTNHEVGTAGDSVQVRADLLTGRFDHATGHEHSGATGDAPPIPYLNLSGIQLRGFSKSQSSITVSGSSANVSTALSGTAVSSGSTVEGAVVTTPNNIVVISDTKGSSFFDGSSNKVYGRLTNSGGPTGTWTLSFYTLVSGVETAYSFAVSTTIDWWIQELYDETNRPVYSDIFTVPSPQGASGGGGGSGGGGNSAIYWVESANAPQSSYQYNQLAYFFTNLAAQILYTLIKVPSTYVAGAQIFLKLAFYSPDSSGTASIFTTAYLIRSGTDAMNSTTNSHASSNSAVTLSSGTVNIPQALSLDLTDTAGKINSIAVSPGDFIQVALTRGTDTGASALGVPVYGCEVLF